MDGVVLSQRFEIRDELGAGASGVVYHALDRRTGRDVALKVLRHAHPDALYRFKREFRCLQGVEHPNLVRLYELGVAGDRWYFTMDLVPGQDFLSFVWGVDPAAGSQDPPTVDLAPRGPRYDETRLRGTFHQLAYALTALHDRRKVHRDLKPSNVIVRPDGHLVVVDFGLVLDAGDQPRHERAGTPAYMAPEQIDGGEIDAPADWYAAGLMLYEAITGCLPFEGSTTEILRARIGGDAPPPSSVTERVPRDLDRLCADLLRLDPALRPSGREILTRLEEPQRVRRITVPPELAGRERELNALVEAARRPAAGRAAAVCLVGPSGVGKSLLLQHASLAAYADPHTVVINACCHPEEHIPFGGIDALIDGLSRVLEELSLQELTSIMGASAGVLTAAFPVLCRVPVLAVVDAEQTRLGNPLRHLRAIVDALVELLRNLSRLRRLVFVIDDLDHADLYGLEILRRLMLHTEAPPVAFLLAARDPELLGLPACVVRVPVAEWLFDDDDATNPQQVPWLPTM